MTLALAISLLVPSVEAAEYATLHSVDDLIDRSEDVVLGRVDALSARLTEAGLIETEVSLMVDDAHHGLSRPAVSFWLPGGQVGETILTVPGTPRVALGDELMVFLDEGRPVGLAQGVWTASDGRFGAASLPVSQQQRVAPAAVMGDVSQTQDCLDGHQQAASEAGWSTRARLNPGNRGHSRRGVAVTLLAGLEYQITICGDGQAVDAWARVYAPDDAVLDEISVDTEGAVLRFRPEQSGRHMVVIGADELQHQAWRTRFGVALAYR